MTRAVLVPAALAWGLTALGVVAPRPRADVDGPDTEELHRILDSYGIANSFELYSGDHVSAVADRMQNHVLPFFSRNLVFEDAH